MAVISVPHVFCVAFDHLSFPCTFFIQPPDAPRLSSPTYTPHHNAQPDLKLIHQHSYNTLQQRIVSFAVLTMSSEKHWLLDQGLSFGLSKTFGTVRAMS